MSQNLRYHRAMRYWTPVFIVLAVALFAASASAQANGAPPSVTSFGFGGHQGFNGVPPSVTSPGPRGPATFHAPQQLPPSAGSGRHRHHDNAYPYYVPYYVPYSAYGDSYDASADQSSAEAADSPDQYQGGPTIFDRRGPGTPPPSGYQPAYAANPVPRPNPEAATARTATIPPGEDPNSDLLATRAPESAPVVSAQPSTVLVFKDGHKQEVGNYAIVGSNLFDLTPGHRMKIALSDLDLPATQKANEDEGIDFMLPRTSNAD